MFDRLTIIEMLLRVIQVLIVQILVAAGSDDSIGEATEVLRWALKRGAVFDQRQIFRKADSNDRKSVRGVFANSFIEEGALLVEVPWDLLVTAEKSSDGDVRCASIEAIRSRLARRSDPYTRLLLRSVPELPFSWPSTATDLLQKLLGGSLPPAALDSRTRWWHAGQPLGCGADPDDFIGAMALKLATARSAGIRNWEKTYAEDASNTWLALAPLYDMFNHRNGKQWHNTRVAGGVGEPLRVYADRNVSAGEQLHLTYGQGADRIFADYGFVEEYPQQWSFGPFSFLVDNGPDCEGCKVTWLSGVPSAAELVKLQGELAGLRSRMETLKEASVGAHGPLIWRYVGSLETALGAAIRSAEGQTWKVDLHRFLNFSLGAVLCWMVLRGQAGRRQGGHEE